MNQIRPQNRKEFISKLTEPYSTQYGNPNQEFSEPLKAGQPEHNRAKEISVKGDTDKNFHIGIKDIDEAIIYYFNNVLKLSVIQNNARLNVPVMYGTPENWKTVQSDGYYRDSNGKLMAPLLMFKRSNITQNRSLGYKLDGNIAKHVQLFERGYSKRNVYSRFDLLNNRPQEKEFVISVIPDYVTIEYQCIIWTHFVEQMDKLIEALNFASRSYWGDPSKFKFYTDIQSFEDNTVYEVGEDRAVKTVFRLTLNGYLIPNTVNAEIAKYARVFSASKIIFGLEVAESPQEMQTVQARPASQQKSHVVAADSINKTINNTTNNNFFGFSPELITYLNTNKNVVGEYVNATTARFPLWLPAPAPLPATDASKFVFAVNGKIIEGNGSIVSFTQIGAYSYLVIDSNVLGYSFDPIDIIEGFGKFV